jgi:hypothetical protein
VPLLSTSWLLLAAGCAVHLGVVPASGSFSVAPVSAPVAEPDVDAWVEEAVTTALSARRALDPQGPSLQVTVTDAAWVPARRSGDVLLYEARLTLRLEGAGRTGTQTRTRTIVDPGDAASARALREATFRSLAREAAEDGVSWLLAAS